MSLPMEAQVSLVPTMLGWRRCRSMMVSELRSTPLQTPGKFCGGGGSRQWIAPRRRMLREKRGGGRA